jgi:hypothetical protein
VKNQFKKEKKEVIDGKQLSSQSIKKIANFITIHRPTSSNT